MQSDVADVRQPTFLVENFVIFFVILNAVRTCYVEVIGTDSVSWRDL